MAVTSGPPEETIKQPGSRRGSNPITLLVAGPAGQDSGHEGKRKQVISLVDVQQDPSAGHTHTGLFYTGLLAFNKAEMKIIPLPAAN